LIHVTRDSGKTWANVTPPELTAWSKVSLMDAGRFDGNTAYAAINRIRLDDMRPHIYRTHDGGKTWTEIVRGLPDNAPVNMVREDPMGKGLLFAGTERAVFVSFNDGDDWQPLRLNMPATSIRDLVIHGDDLVVGTHGRSFWILDDISPLRQLNSKTELAAAHLFRAQTAIRVRWNVNTDTPLPPDEAGGQNPPDGAIIYYWLRESAKEPVTLEIFDDKKRIVRRYSSADKPAPVDATSLEIPTYWIRPPQELSAVAGSHRFIWDLHYPPPAGRLRYPMTAIFHDTPSEPMGPWVLPGTYMVRLTVGEDRYEQPLTVKMDPRVQTPADGLRQQFELSLQCYEGAGRARETVTRVRKFRGQLKSAQGKVTDKALAEAITELEKKVSALEGAERGRGPRFAAAPREPTFGQVAGEMQHLLEILQGADATPTSQAVAAVAETQKTLYELTLRWLEIIDKDVKGLNERLGKSDLPMLTP
jgi:hypothetical protein